jgi:hypothetical protein
LSHISDKLRGTSAVEAAGVTAHPMNRSASLHRLEKRDVVTQVANYIRPVTS